MLRIDVDRTSNPSDGQVLEALADSCALLIADAAKRSGDWQAGAKFTARLRALLAVAERQAGRSQSKFR